MRRDLDMDNIESSDVRTWKKSGDSFSNNGSSPIKVMILLIILWMGTKKMALKRSHTEKAKLTRARPRFSFGFSKLKKSKKKRKRNDVGLDCFELDWIGLDWTRLNYFGLIWIGLIWIGLD